MSLDPNTIQQGFDYLPESTKEALFNPTADAIGQGIGGIFYWLFQKPIKLKIIKESEFAELANKTAQNLQQIPKENRTDEKKGLMIKAIESSQYSLDSSTLRECFAKLIANTADSSLVDQVSPSFAMFLGNMSSKDAKFLALFKNETGLINQLPIANIKTRVSKEENATANTPVGTFKILDSGLVVRHTRDGVTFNQYNQQIDLLISFGLLTKTYDEYSPDFKKDYDLLEESIITPDLKEAVTKSLPAFDEFFVEKGSVRLTSLGKSFVKCVIP